MSLQALIWVTVNAGLMKPRRGFTPVAGMEKLGARADRIDKYLFLKYDGPLKTRK